MPLRVDRRIRSGALRGAGGRFESPIAQLDGPRARDRVSATRGGGFSDTLTPGITALALTLEADVNRALLEIATEMEAYAKQNAPWGDRTTNARQGLVTFVEDAIAGGTITLAHTVYYGVYLELHFNGRFAIIMPTIEEFGPRLMARIGGMR